MKRDASSGAARRGPGLAGVLAVLLALGGCVAAPEQPAEVRPIVFPPPPDPARFYYERTIFSTADVLPVSDEDRLRTLLTGLSGREGTPLSKPFDVAVHRGRVFVTDTVRRTVMVFDFVEQRSFEIGTEAGPAELAKPLGVAVDGTGTLYVVDATQHRVNVYDRDGRYLRSLGGSKLLERPSGIDVEPDGKMVYVVDTGGVDSTEHHIRVFDGATGRHLRDLGARGTGPGQLNLPRDVARAPNGLLYVTDGGNFRVAVFQPDGRFVRGWGEIGRRYGQFSRPKGIAADAAGNIYVADASHGNFQVFDAEGRLLLFVGDRANQNAPAKYTLPAGVTVDEDGRVYMVDQFFRKVDVFRPATLEAGAGHLGAAGKGKGP